MYFKEKFAFQDYRNHRQEIISKLVNLMEEVCNAHLEKVSFAVTFLNLEKLDT